VIKYVDQGWCFDWVEFGIDVREAREKQGLTVKELAAKTPLGQSRVSAIENGTDTEGIHMANFTSLCNALQLDPRKYWTLEDNRNGA